MRVPRLRPPSGLLDRIGDLASDLAVWAFATWTVLYHLGRLLGLGTSVVLVATLVVTALVSLVTWRHLDGAGEPVPVGTESRSGADAPAVARSWWPFAVSLGLAVAAGVVHWLREPGLYVLGWALMVAALVPLAWTLVAPGSAGERSGTDGSRDDVGDAVDGPGADAEPALEEREGSLGTARRVAELRSSVVWVVAFVLAYLSLRTVRLDADDVFYVNKAVFVAETGRIPTRDTIYSDQTLPALRGAGTAPVQSLEVLQGAVAHLLGVQAGTVVYLVTPAVMSVLAVWAAWRLVRSWSAVRALVAFGVAMAYLVWGVPNGYGLGAFFIGRIWQGKVIFVCLALPLLYLGLTRWAQRRRRYDGAMLFALGTVAIGLTSTATLVVPPIAAGVAVTLLVARRRGWAGPLLAAVYPLASGVVVAAVASGGGEFGAVAFSSFEAFHVVVGDGIWGAVGLAGLLVAPWAVRAGGPRLVAAGGSAVAVAVMAPGVPQLVNSVTGAGPILYRLMWVAALPVLVGVLATAPVPAALAGPVVRRTAAVAVPALLVVLVVVGGQLIWSRSTTLEDGPRWKYSHTQLQRARWVAATYEGDGPVLGPWPLMRALALTTTRVHAVDPRSFYLDSLDEPGEDHAARLRLSESMRNGNTLPPPELAEDLAALGVEYVCLDAPKARYRKAITELGWDPVASRSGVTCFRQG